MIFLDKEIGLQRLPFMVAEISCNHEGDILKATELISQVKEAGADAVKIQIYNASDMTLHSDKPEFIIKDGPWKGQHLWNLYAKTCTPDFLATDLFQAAVNIGIPIFASVFSERGLRAAENLGCQAYKIASFEITDLNLIRKVAYTGKPVVISTGLASLNDIDQAMQCVNPYNSVLMHCISAYPHRVDQANLHKIPFLHNLYPYQIGYSDHTNGIMSGPLAVAMGARMIEKHVALENNESEDASFSLYPNEFSNYVKRCNLAAQATFKVDVPQEEYSRQFRRSLYVVQDVKQGDFITNENVRAIRPSYGLPAQQCVLGKKFIINVKAGTALREDMFIT